MNRYRNFLAILLIFIFLIQSGCLVFASGNVPEEIVGTWMTGSTSSVVFQDPRDGSYSDPSGTQVMYKISVDGRYEYAALTSQSMYNCTTKLLTYKTGYVRINGQTITFIPSSGKFTSEDNCNKQYNYEKPATLDRETYEWSVRQDEYGAKLCFQNSEVNGCAYRRDGKEIKTD